MRKVILASKSPRRREIFASLGIPVAIVCCDTDETYKEGTPPDEVVRSLAARKCRTVAEAIHGNADSLTVAAEKNGGDIVVAADTVVFCGNEIMGKPKNADGARAMLKKLSGTNHRVYTGIAIIADGKEVSDSDFAEVCFRELSDAEIESYIASGEPMDKAGAYGIQERGGLFVKKITGDFSTVVGFPVCLFGELMRCRFGIDPFSLMK